MSTKMKDQKQKITAALAVVLVAALAVGGTLAYLTAVTDEKENEFTFVTAGDDGDEDMTVTIWEPTWDGESPDEYDDINIPGDDEEWGENVSKDVAPGRVIPKDPLLENSSSKEIGEWMAMTVEFWSNGVAAEGINPEALTPAQIDYLFGDDGYVSIDYNLSAWAFSHKYTNSDTGAVVYVYIYENEVKAGKITDPLFTEVNVDIEAQNSYVDTIAAYGGFNIKIQGYAVQSENVSYADASALFGRLGNGSTDIFLDSNR